MRRHLVVFAVPILMAAAALAQTASKPNLSGVWKLDSQASNWGLVPPADSARYVIRHVGTRLSMEYFEDSHSQKIDFVPDGEEHTVVKDANAETIIRPYWEGSVLVIESRVRPGSSTSNQLPAEWTSKWSVSPDGKSLTIARHIKVRNQTTDQSLVFRKQ
ncbi:MAG: hypothetical protein ACR2IF_08555 [Terriglobales bacterium]